jgi:hypothetical protein
MANSDDLTIVKTKIRLRTPADGSSNPSIITATNIAFVPSGLEKIAHQHL